MRDEEQHPFPSGQPCCAIVSTSSVLDLTGVHQLASVFNVETFTPFGVPGCKPEATLVPETGVAAAQHTCSFQAKPVPT